MEWKSFSLSLSHPHTHTQNLSLFFFLKNSPTKLLKRCVYIFAVNRVEITRNWPVPTYLGTHSSKHFSNFYWTVVNMRFCHVIWHLAVNVWPSPPISSIMWLLPNANLKWAMRYLKSPNLKTYGLDIIAKNYLVSDSLFMKLGLITLRVYLFMKIGPCSTYFRPFQSSQ